ncbi:transposase [Metabacillus dongyingensis]|uniref:IS110 family transposase n=1 Tax=Metabacillus dongyingensis TaxID=2874282 RepID=UPI003B8AB02D
MEQHGMDKVIIGMEPTGYYRLNLAHFIKEEKIKFLAANPMYVNKSKELDENSPTKNDGKGAKVIAQLTESEQPFKYRLDR